MIILSTLIEHLISRSFWDIHWRGVLTLVSALFGWCHLKLPSSWYMFSVHHYHHTTMHQFTLSLYSKPHRQGVCVFSCNLPSALLAEWTGFCVCYCGNMGVEQVLKWVGTERVCGEEIFPLLLPGIELCTLRLWIGPSATDLSPLPVLFRSEHVLSLYNVHFLYLWCSCFFCLILKVSVHTCRTCNESLNVDALQRANIIRQYSLVVIWLGLLYAESFSVEFVWGPK